MKKDIQDYRKTLESLVKNAEVVIDRPKNSTHPRYPSYIYPLDYGYIVGTQAQDGGGIDVWCGSGDRKSISGVLVIFDPIKKDSEIKILLGCDNNESEQALACSQRGDMVAFKIDFEAVI